MKKIISLFLALCMISSLVFVAVSCDSSEFDEITETTSEVTTVEETTTEETTAEETTIEETTAEETTVEETTVAEPKGDSIGLEYELNQDGNGYSVCGIGSCTDLYIVIPSEYNGLPVVFVYWPAFTNCSSVTSIVIPDSITYIEPATFKGCSSLETLIVDANNPNYYSEGNCIIEKSTGTLVVGCKTSIIPNGVTSIGGGAFYGCSALTSVTIPDSVTSIGGSAFLGCSSLTSTTIPDSVTSIGNGAFEDCSSLTSVTIPDGLTSIGAVTFSGCSSLTSITIPDSVTRISTSAFRGCSSLETLIVDANNPNYYSEGNCIIEKSTKTLILGCKNSIIPDDVTSIVSSAFYGCITLTSITIPDSVTSIGSGAFRGCSALTSITIPDSVTSIDSYTLFYGCSSLTSITIPNSVISIDDYAFGGCSSLTSIIFNGTIEQWNNISLSDNWNSNTGDYTIYCTDGEITKN